MMQNTSHVIAALGLLSVVMMVDPSQVMLCSSFTVVPLQQAKLLTASITSTTTTTTTALSMGLKNKQADMKRKLELAKQQMPNPDGSPAMDAKADETPKAVTAEQIKAQNDRKRFEQLLKREGGKSLNAYQSDGYLNKEQEEEEITAARSGVDRIFEGDPAPSDCFEDLVSVTSENKVAKKGAGRLAPWISNDYGIDADDYRVVICDPRKQSTEFHQVVKDLCATLPKDIKDRLYFVNADTPAENRRWMKKNGLQNNADMYCDTENMDFMKEYSALGENRWSMTMFVLRKGKVAKLARDLDIYNAPRTVTNAVKAMKTD